MYKRQAKRPTTVRIGTIIDITMFAKKAMSAKRFDIYRNTISRFYCCLLYTSIDGEGTTEKVHNAKHFEAKEPTCDVDGNMEYWLSLIHI